MSVNGKNTIHFTKKDLESQKSIAVGFKKVKFYHQATLDDTTIDLLSLTLPSTGIAAGSTNPSAGDLAAANLFFNKDNLLLISSLSGLLDFDSYTVTSSTTIELSDPAEDGEIFIGIIDYVAKTGLLAVDTDPLVVTGTLAAGDTEFIVGKPFDLNKYPTQQQGAILVFLDGQLMARNVGNVAAAPAADGDYQEQGAGLIGNAIEFNEADGVNDRSVMVINAALMAVAPSVSVIAQIENLAGQIDNMVPVLAALAGVSETLFQSAPNNVDLQAFGQRVIALEDNLAEGGDPANGPVLASGTSAGAVKDSTNANSTQQFLAIDYRKTVIAADNDLTGNIYLYRIDNMITLIADNLTHASLASASTSTGLIPVGYRPENSASALNCYLYDETHGLNIQVATDGTVTFFYRNETGNVNRTSTLKAFVTYRTTDA